MDMYLRAEGKAFVMSMHDTTSVEFIRQEVADNASMTR